MEKEKCRREQRIEIDFPILNAENINYLNKILRKMNTLIIIKTHPIQADLEIFNEAFSNIKILRNKDFEDKDIIYMKYLMRLMPC